MEYVIGMAVIVAFVWLMVLLPNQRAGCIIKEPPTTKRPPPPKGQGGDQAPALRIAALVQCVATRVSYERGSVCAVDCLLQWHVGKLDETIEAWERDMKERATGQSHTDEVRHGAWVPAIPLRVK